MEILVVGIAGLFILGPERLPAAAAWTGRSIRKVRDFASGARDQLKNELGSDFDDLRKPLQDLQQLRSFDPKSIVTKTLFGEDQPTAKPNGYAGTQPALPPAPPTLDPPKPGDRPKIDPDAT